MHCPGCGVKVSANQNFCRSCGFGLEKVSQLVAEQLTAEQKQAAIEIGKGSDDRLHLMEWLGIIGWYTFIGGGAMGVILIFYTIISKLIIDKGQIIPGIALLLFLAGALLLLPYIHYMESQKDSAKRKRQLSKALAEEEATGKLPPETHSEIKTSVTDHTTELLETRNVKVTQRTRGDELRD
jgi:hypothetical protein